MMALDRGGQCKGMALRLPSDRLRESLDQLFRREMTMKPVGNVVRWVQARTSEGPLPALAFVVNRESPRYVGRLALEEVAEVVATAAGHWGSCAQYLQETVALLDQNGIRDRNLWRLQELVARKIAHREGGVAGHELRVEGGQTR
jgi:cation transport protein ChaC